MAYMNQEKKAAITAELKKVMPKGWKYSLKVLHHSTIALTIASAPVDLVAENLRSEEQKRGGIQLNQYYLDREYTGELLQTFEAINAALNLNNFNESDVYTDYHHVGHYVDINIGRWDKEFSVSPAA